MTLEQLADWTRRHHEPPGEHFYGPDCRICAMLAALGETEQRDAMTPESRSAEEWAKECNICHGSLYDHNDISQNALCLRCARAYAIQVGKAVREGALDWLAHRCEYAPPCGRCTYCSVTAVIRQIEVRTP